MQAGIYTSPAALSQRKQPHLIILHACAATHFKLKITHRDFTAYVPQFFQRYLTFLGKRWISEGCVRNNFKNYVIRMLEPDVQKRKVAVIVQYNLYDAFVLLCLLFVLCIT
jgi:hypothetical protein